MQTRLIMLALIALTLMPPGLLAEDTAPPESRVVDAYIDLHTQPGRNYPVFYVAERGEHIELLKRRTDWVKVRNNRGIEGWVHIDAIGRTVDTNGAALGFTSPNRDTFNNRNWEFGLMLGDLDGTDAITGYGAWQFTRNLSLEAAYTENYGDFSDGKMADWQHRPPDVSCNGAIRPSSPLAAACARPTRDPRW